MNDHVHPIMQQIMEHHTPPDSEPFDWRERLDDLCEKTATHQEESAAADHGDLPDPDNIEALEYTLRNKATALIAQITRPWRLLQELFPGVDPAEVWETVDGAASEPVAITLAKSRKEQRRQLGVALGGNKVA